MRFFCPAIKQSIPYIASRHASISCRGLEDEMDVVEGQEDEILSLNVEKIFWFNGEQDPT